MSDGDNVGEIVTSCPQCGCLSSVTRVETLAPQVCGQCSQLHVATMNGDYHSSSETIPHPDSEVPQDKAPNCSGQIARYQVTRILGSGAFGVVYLAWDPSLHRWVAIKVPKLLGPREQMVEEFLREARTIAQLRHSRIASVFDAATENGQPYIVTEYVEGDTLASHIHRANLSPRKAARVVYEIATALHYAHQQGIVHRDVKPGNIMIDKQGQPRLMDFGLAQQIRSDGSVRGKLSGTPAYMAPELINGKTLGDQLSDQYSLGVVLYECLAGKRPFDGSVSEVLQRIVNEIPPRPIIVKNSIPKELDEICVRMMDQDPDRRFKDVGAVAKQLSTFLRPTTDVSIPTASHESQSQSKGIPGRRWVVLASSVAVLLVCSALLIPLLQPASEVPDSPNLNPVAARETDPEKIADSMVERHDAGDVTQINPATITENIVATSSTAGSDADAAPRAAIMQANPADALDAVAEATRYHELTPTYPKIVGLSDRQCREFCIKLRQILVDAFPAVVGERMSDEAYLAAVQQLDDLEKMSPSEPRLYFAKAVIRHKILPGNKIKKESLPDELALLRKAETQGGYAFTPALMSEVEFHLRGTSPNINAARDALIQLAQVIGTTSAWPDKPERMRVAFWMGSIYGFYASGASGKSAHDAIILTSEPTVKQYMQGDVREAFLESMAETQRQVTERLTLCGDNKAAAKAEHEKKAKEALEENQKQKKQLDQDKQAIEGETEDSDAKYQAAIQECLIEIQKLKIQWDQTSVQQQQLEGDRGQLYSAIGIAQQQLSDLDQLIADGGTDENGIRPFLIDTIVQAQIQLPIVESQLQQVYLRMRQIAEKASEWIREGQRIEREFKPRDAKNRELAANFNQEVQDLDMEAKVLKLKPVKIPPKVTADCRTAKLMSSWVEWTAEDGKNWLLTSISGDAKAEAKP